MPNSTGFQSIVGIDIAKSVFQVYSCDTDTGVITNEKIKRDKLLERFTNVPPCLIGMEACGSSQYWARWTPSSSSLTSLTIRATRPTQKASIMR